MIELLPPSKSQNWPPSVDPIQRDLYSIVRECLSFFCFNNISKSEVLGIFLKKETNERTRERKIEISFVSVFVTQRDLFCYLGKLKIKIHS